MTKRLSVYAVCLVMLGLAGCSQQGGESAANGSAADGAGSGGSVSSTTGNAGEPSLSNVDNGSALLDAGSLTYATPDASDSTPGQCGASSFEAQQVVTTTEVQVTTQVTTTKPVALYIMLDQSLSMTLSNIWKPAVNSIETFVADDKSQGLSVGLQYFPLNGAINKAACSTGKPYSTPDVAMGALPGQSQAISDSLDSHNASGIGTPIEGALRGVTEFCKTYQTAHPEQQCVAVLVTDGKPEYDSGCVEDQDKLAAIAAAAHTVGITTFAVGLKGADFTLLDKIAKAGGAPDCDTTAASYACDVSANADKLVTALAAIRDTVVTTETHPVVMTHTEQTKLPCEWVIPTPPARQVFDPNKVNIRLTAPELATTFARVDSADKCTVNAWHFDDPSAPTHLVACPQTCDLINATVGGKIDVLLGCATVSLQ